MTCANRRDRAGSVPAIVPHRVRKKATLFCPRCHHESSIDGDWVLTLRPETVDVHCPDCRELLTRRPDDWAVAKERSVSDR